MQITRKLQIIIATYCVVEKKNDQREVFFILFIRCACEKQCTHPCILKHLSAVLYLFIIYLIHAQMLIRL